MIWVLNAMTIGGQHSLLLASCNFLVLLVYSSSSFFGRRSLLFHRTTVNHWKETTSGDFHSSDIYGFHVQQCSNHNGAFTFNVWAHTFGSIFWSDIGKNLTFGEEFFNNWILWKIKLNESIFEPKFNHQFRFSFYYYFFLNLSRFFMSMFRFKFEGSFVFVANGNLCMTINSWSAEGCISFTCCLWLLLILLVCCLVKALTYFLWWFYSWDRTILTKPWIWTSTIAQHKQMTLMYYRTISTQLLVILKILWLAIVFK